VQLGFLPKSLSPRFTYHYPIRTDAEGFRNEKVRASIDIAALGDSFTDGTASPREVIWPSRLEKITGRTVQNYGTSGFGPQQELYALEDYALRHHPRIVVLAFFAGNDLLDAEAFDRWEHTDLRPDEGRSGWVITDSFCRYETLFLWTVAQVAFDLVRHDVEAVDAPGAIGAVSTARFHEGLFSVPVQNRTLNFAFLPPYLQNLREGRAQIAASRGWALACDSLEKMKAACGAQGAQFVVMLIPSKPQVYWPLCERAFTRDQLLKAISFLGQWDPKPLATETVSENRLALNGLLRDFCGDAQIPFLDLTPALEREVEQGRQVYFPDDPHWNAKGHDVAAHELARFLEQEGPPSVR
jgi:lysophospholipase L1-like esterase